ncbi:hypothetical protein SFR_2075 [Streptomyces sp. FR-008]|nr:hypothetical protein SFR_2075 [Streptomyces sp. FR-008]
MDFPAIPAGASAHGRLQHRPLQVGGALAARADGRTHAADFLS